MAGSVLVSLLVVVLSLGVVHHADAGQPSEVWTRDVEDMAGFRRSHIVSPLPSEYVNVNALPTSFSWASVNGTTFLTKNLNQVKIGNFLASSHACK